VETEFDRAARAVVDGEAATLRALVAADPALVRARSGDAFDATLLHFVSANGVPDELQLSPVNAPEIAGVLLAAGAEPDAVGGAYGGGEDATPLCLLVSSWPPHARGVQAELVRVLVEGGAAPDGRRGDGAPLTTALTFGYTAAAEALVRAGARPLGLVHHAGLGRLDDVRVCARERGAPLQEALHVAVTHGRLDAAELLVERGADVNGRTTGHHCELPLLQAAFVHEVDAALWLLDRGADPDLVDGKRGVSTRAYVRDSGPAALGSRLAPDG
jgi:hypothetical protein